jgi:hypothetical protein
LFFSSGLSHARYDLKGNSEDNMNDYTYDKYLDKWNSRYGESQSAEVNYSSLGVILPMTINRLSPEIFEHTKNKLRKLHEEFSLYSEINYEEGMEQTLLKMAPYELVLLIT